MIALKDKVLTNCMPGMCLEECVPVVKELMENPCFNGTLRTKNLLAMVNHWDNEVKLQYYEFWYRADSCLEQLRQTETCNHEQTVTTNAATGTPGVTMSIFVIFLLSLL